MSFRCNDMRDVVAIDKKDCGIFRIKLIYLKQFNIINLVKNIVLIQIIVE